MSDLEQFNRRDFHRLSAIALGGLAAGSLIGCSEQAAGPANPTATPAPATGTEVASTSEKAEGHLCRGLNACKGEGGCGTTKGKNECAGRGECATAERHDCGTLNACKGLGGCGPSAGANDCKGKGGCHVPLMSSAWKTVRKRFEEKMVAAGKPFGEAPAEKAH